MSPNQFLFLSRQIALLGAAALSISSALGITVVNDTDEGYIVKVEDRRAAVPILIGNYILPADSTFEIAINRPGDSPLVATVGGSTITFQTRVKLTADATLRITNETEAPDMPQQISMRSSRVDGNQTVEVGDGTRLTQTFGQRKLNFLATADPQYSQHNADEEPASLGILHTNETLRRMSAKFSADPLCRGILLAGDLTQFAVESEFDNYKEAISGTEHAYFEGLGNHDYYGDSFTGNPDVSDELVDYVGGKGRVSRQAHRQDIHYSWDWHDVHFVQLNLAPVDGLTFQNDGYEDPRNALTFLKQDLAANVGNSYRPVVLIFHLGFDTFSFPVWWGSGDPLAIYGETNVAFPEPLAVATNLVLAKRRVTTFWNAVADYNVAAIFTGHLHTANEWRVTLERTVQVGPTSSVEVDGIWRTTFHKTHMLDLVEPGGTLGRPDGRTMLRSFVAGGATAQPSGDDPPFDFSNAINFWLEAEIDGDQMTVTRRELGQQSDGSYFESGAEFERFDLFGDKADDDISTTSELGLNGEAKGFLHNGDHDFYKFELAAPTTVTIRSTGTVDTVGVLRDSAGVAIVVDDDAGSGKNFSIERSLAAGTYFIDVGGWDQSKFGAYSVVLFTDAPTFTLVPGDIDLAFNRGETPDARAVGYSLTNWDSNLEYQVSTDAWWMLVPQIGQASPGNGSFQLGFDTAALGGGTFTGQLTIHVPFLGQTDTIDVTLQITGPPDDFLDNVYTAGANDPLSGAPTQGEIEVAGDADWIRIDVAEAGVLEVFTTGTTDTVGTLHSGDGSFAFVTQDDSPPSNRNFRITHEVVPGIYYIELSAFDDRRGPYELWVRLHTDGLPNPLTVEDGWLIIDSLKGRDYQLLLSPDLRRWSFAPGGSSVEGAGGPLSAQLPLADPNIDRLFYLSREDAEKPMFAAHFSTSGGTEGSAVIGGQHSEYDFQIGVPVNFGDTAMLLDGEPLSQENGVVIASSASATPGSQRIVQAAGELSDTPGSFPSGTWISTSNPAGSDVTVPKVSLVHFPFADGWSGGHIGAAGNQLRTGNLPADFNFQQQQPGLTSVWDPAGDIGPFKGALFAIGAEGSDVANVVGLGTDFAGGTVAWEVGISEATANQDAWHAAPWSFAYVPFDTLGLKVGWVLEDGSTNFPRDGAGFSCSWDAENDRYVLQIPGEDLSQGSVLINSMQWIQDGPLTNVRPRICHFEWEVAPAGDSLYLYATELPLDSGGLVQCGFVFAFVPFDSVVFGK